MATTDNDRLISASLLRLRRSAPFFAALSLFARFRADGTIPTAQTDGRDVFYNPAFLCTLPARQMDAVLLHEVLHAALTHPLRCGAREPVRWNIAADIVVNGIVAKQSFVELPPHALREPTLEDRSVEEIYELLRTRNIETCPRCMRPRSGAGADDPFARLAEAEAYWRDALRHAEVVARTMAHGQLPAGMDRLLDQVGTPQLDWRAQLWRFLVRTPTDFSGFDRRFLYQRLYLEALEGESVRVYLAVDTSGSITGPLLAALMSEVRGIVRAYPRTEAQLFYADAALYGPFDIEDELAAPKPRGGGGTSFVPFFEHIEREHDGRSEAVCIYLTDGYGPFPARPPALPVLWVVVPGGALDSAFPFGEVARLLDVPTE